MTAGADHREIRIHASAEAVFDNIARRVNKFPTFAFFDTAPFFFLRMLLIGGVRSAWRLLTDGQARREMATLKEYTLAVSEKMGPFELDEVQRPTVYFFRLETALFSLRTGYRIRRDDTGATLALDTEIGAMSRLQAFYWTLIMPIHVVLARRSLRRIKRDVEKACCARRAPAS